MSRKNSKKELNGVYRRCLSALNQRPGSFKAISADSMRKFQGMVAAEAAEKNASKEFKNSDEEKAWVKSSIASLCNAQLAKQNSNPLAALKAQIEAKIA